MPRNITTHQLLQPAKAGGGARSKGGGQPTMACGHAAVAILCALFLWRIPTARHPSYSIMGRQEPGLRPAALQGARQHDTLWPLESNHHFVAALAPLAGSISTPNNTTYLRATLRARHLQICGERRTLSQTLTAYPRLRGISHHPQDLHWRDRPPHGALGACCQPPRHGGMRRRVCSAAAPAPAPLHVPANTMWETWRSRCPPPATAAAPSRRRRRRGCQGE